MAKFKPESPLILEEVFLKRGYTLHYKDEWTCSLLPPKGIQCPPLCIPQDVSESGMLSASVVDGIVGNSCLNETQYNETLKIIKN
jgi:hypothetical protein